MFFKKGFLRGFQVLFLFSAALWGAEDPPGWMWYRDPLREAAPEESVSPTPEDLDALTPAEVKARGLGRRFEAQVALSIQNPTVENVYKAQALQREIFARAERFQARWQQVSLLDPENHVPQDNPNTAHRVLYKKQEEAARDLKLTALAREWGLFFLFKKGCPYCDQFAPQVKRLETRYGFEVKAVSLDGGRLPLYPEARPDNGAMAALNPQGIYPALLLAHPPSGMVIPVSWGLTSYTQLLENIEK